MADMPQETSLAVWRAARELGGVGSRAQRGRPLSTIGANRLVDAIRRHPRQERGPAAALVEETVPGAEDEVMASHVVQGLEEALLRQVLQAIPRDACSGSVWPDTPRRAVRLRPARHGGSAGPDRYGSGRDRHRQVVVPASRVDARRCGVPVADTAGEVLN
ncbi:hypothetical protein GCM10023082_33950 [Streptomyces tremellae]|uniref:Uncharacterized protein n=1 Tax=Streptomyces tremellae TaxID=1124239 RepID=A0ABP7F8U0_9ACTN